MIKLLVVLAIAIAPFVAVYRLNSRDQAQWDDEPLVLAELLGKSCKVSVDQFDVFNELGKGVFGHVYVARKYGGSDDGRLYALKAMKILDADILDAYYQLYNNELEVMKAIKDVPFSIGLHYAFRECNWLFLVMDLVTGGNLHDKLDAMDKVDAVTAKLIAAELIVAVERMHKAKIVHLDLHDENVLIDRDGHLVVIDYSFSKWYSRNDLDFKTDWTYAAYTLEKVGNQIPTDVFELMINMTDVQMPELKNHRYFEGIDWNDVESKYDPPFSANATEIILKGPVNVTELFKSDINDKFAAQIAEKIPSNLKIIHLWLRNIKTYWALSITINEHLKNSDYSYYASGVSANDEMLCRFVSNSY